MDEEPPPPYSAAPSQLTPTRDGSHAPPSSHTLPTDQQASAALYFESRQPPAYLAVLDMLVHTVQLSQNASSDDFPYRSEWAERDVSAQDWATFLNYLLPNHSSKENEAVIDQKMMAEGNDLPHVQAQLEHLRNAHTDATPTQDDVEATAQQWNEGFFGPRRLKINVEPLVQSQSEPQSIGGTSRFKFGSGKYGLQVGKGLIGLDLTGSRFVVGYTEPDSEEHQRIAEGEEGKNTSHSLE